MDLLIFGSTLSVGLLVGLTLKKHDVYLIPQSFGLFMNNREYFDQLQKDQEQADRDTYFYFKNSTRHPDTRRS